MVYKKKTSLKIKNLHTPMLHCKFLQDYTRLGHTSSHGRTVVEKRREN